MTETLSKHERNLGAVIHASTFCRFLIPFGNFLAPLVLWLANREEKEFVDFNGRQVLNFQISMLLYSIILGILSLPFIFGSFPGILEFDGWNSFYWNPFRDIHFNFDSGRFRHGQLLWSVGVAGALQLVLFLLNLVLSILGTVRSNEGQYFTYPLTIKFIR